MVIQDIIASAHGVKGELKDVELSDLGKEKFAKGYEFDGSFKYEASDFPAILKLMTGNIDTDKFKATANGFVAGHDSEFVGQIIVLEKFQGHKEEKRDYHKVTVNLDGKGCGTIAVMEWIDAHGCPDLSFTEFSERGLFVLIVSNLDERASMFVDCDREGLVEWHELDINGKKAYRHFDGFSWIFKINGKYYIATK